MSRYSCQYDNGNKPVLISLSLYDVSDMNGRDKRIQRSN